MSLVKLPNGTTLFVNKQGSGPVVIALHGLGGTHNLFYSALQLAGITSTHTVVCIDLAGHGLSPPNKDPTSVLSYVDDLHSLISTLGVDKVALVGQSWGSIISALYASAHPEKISALGLWTMISTPLPAEVTAGQKGLLTGVRGAGVPTIADGFVSSLYTTGDGATPAVGAALRAMMLSTSTQSFADAFEGLTRWSAQESGIKWHTFKFPFYLVTGSHDQLHPPVMAEAIKKVSPPSTKLVVVEGLGHSLPLEAPAETGKLLKALLAAA